jgi:predicted PurR-regulated permease PerM
MQQPLFRDSSRHSNSQRIALAVLMGLGFLVVAWMIAPLLLGLALGTVMGFTAQPLYERFAARLEHRRLASAAVTLIAGLLMAGGGAVAVWLVAREVVVALALVQRMTGHGPAALGPRAVRLLDALGVQRDVLFARLQGELGHLADLAARAAGVVVEASLGGVVTLIVALWTMYYVVLDWGRIAGHLERLLPLDPLHTRALVDEFRHVGRTAFVGTVASAAVQAVLAGIGFAGLGVPQAVTWAAVLGVASFIPVVGVPLVWVPLAISLAWNGHLGRGIALTAWCVVVVGIINDYIIRPRLVGGRRAGHPLLTLVAMLGGISVFGLAGVVLGPVIMALFLATARIYERERDGDRAAAVGLTPGSPGSSSSPPSRTPPASHPSPGPDEGSS